MYVQRDNGRGYMITKQLEEKSRHSDSTVVETNYVSMVSPEPHEIITEP
jgi:hypothetical protein